MLCADFGNGHPNLALTHCVQAAWPSHHPRRPGAVNVPDAGSLWSSGPWFPAISPAGRQFW